MKTVSPIFDHFSRYEIKRVLGIENTGPFHPALTYIPIKSPDFDFTAVKLKRDCFFLAPSVSETVMDFFSLMSTISITNRLWTVRIQYVEILITVLITDRGISLGLSLVSVKR